MPYPRVIDTFTFLLLIFILLPFLQLKKPSYLTNKGNPAISKSRNPAQMRPVAFRPYFSIGLALLLLNRTI